MSVVRLDCGVYALYDKGIGLVASGTLKEMEALLRVIVYKCGTELKCQSVM